MSQIATPSVETNAAACPRCQKPLIDPNGLGWCKGCGYCRSLAESETKTEKVVESKPNTVTATSAAIVQTPTWFWVMLIGMAVIVAATWACGHYLKFTPLSRALWTCAFIGIGVALMFLGQFIALLRIAPDDSTLGFLDALVPFRLYGLVMKRLPSTQLTVHLAAWAIAGIIGANIFIGGLPHLLNYLPGNQKNQKSK